MEVAGMRTSYNERDNLFLEDDLEIKEPLYLFDKWFKIVKNDPRTVEPNAMCLATATNSLCSYERLQQGRLYFFLPITQEENPHAALTFYWEHYSRSVRIEGTVEKLPFSDADNYFNKRPYQSQIGALCSQQSEPIRGRNVLAMREKDLKSKYKEGQVPRPPLWGGYIVKPNSIEFWQGQTDRIHDRIRFRRPRDDEPDGILTHDAEDGWVYERLCP
ncbi:hypothetical protein NQ315_015153 [Exocentrus adspersus]|uniref:pyridoxal 5'-phosphate synthase n=1 Tax=Exocentrus adspersus TaxID=1586481 RepID=A0AAV8VFK6_9CUCU|nr:hypothetical protein NQ315_015153 [Exocentrus adspersus]